MKTEVYEYIAASFFKPNHRNHDKLEKGLAEEANEVLKASTREEKLDELGDVLWYVTIMAKELDSSLKEIMLKNFSKLEIRELNPKKE